MYTLESRQALAAVDGAPVTSTLGAVLMPQIPALAVASLSIVLTGAPTVYTVRAGIDMSFDGGTTWCQVVRFKDISNTQTKMQVVRAATNTTVAEVDVVAVDLTAAAAAAVVPDTPWFRLLRASTQLQAMSGGAAPTVSIQVLLDIQSG